MEKYTFETTNSFNEMVEDLGINAISDLDIGKECDMENIEFSKLESWEYEGGILTIFAEPTKEYNTIIGLIEKRELTKDEITTIEECSLVENCTYQGMEYAGNTTDCLYHVKFYGQDEVYSVVTED